MVENSNKKAKEETPIKIVEESFKNFRLRRIVKENHGSDIPQLAMGVNCRLSNNSSDNLSNLLLTISQSQINVYDNEHYGDHLDLMCHFKLPEEDSENNILSTCCWVECEEDAIIAFGGSSGIIHLVSIAYSQEFARLTGHDSGITDLVRHPTENSLILSCSKDGTVRLWNIFSKVCTLKFKYNANSLCFNATGTSIFCGSNNGSVKEFALPDPKTLFAKAKSGYVELTQLSHLSSSNHGSPVDCLSLAGDKVVSKSLNGKIVVWVPQTGEVTLKFLVRNSISSCSRFGLSEDLKFMCVGNSLGATCVYSLSTGKLLSELRHRRSTKPIAACTFARRGRNIICSTVEGALLRFDYITPETLEAWRKWEQNEK